MNYDIVVIGGGIHGAGVAQAAAAGGYSVLLLEKNSIASGTSSRSSKLIHGGLRYLESAQFGLVRESLHERETLLRIAPTLVRRVNFFIPVYASTLRRPWKIRAGLSLYALLGGGARGTGFKTLARTRWHELDGLDTRGLQCVFQYQDAQTDDVALTQAVVRSAQTLGAQIECGADFLAGTRHDAGFEVRYRHANDEKNCRAGVLVNAAGPWVNTVLERISPRPSQLAVDLVQGSHILLEGEIRQGIYYIEAPSDRRAVFVMPWKGKTLVGTTETAFDGDADALHPRPQEIIYLQETLRRYFPQASGSLIASFAGLRVLPRASGSLFHRSRETTLHADTTERARLITIYGGKLTGYRATATKVMQRLKTSLPATTTRANTAHIMLSA
ncbi:MAG: FAD-dependent oxidoreductase [Gammaproteobacteria bacterium]|nr:FAD-dependent oxidoreductase [Gammaproteobacteria bacterium]